MKTARKIVQSFLFVVAGTLMVVSQAQVNQPCQDHKIQATGVGQDLGGGNTVAQISDGGLLQGTTAAQFEITDFSLFPVLPISGTVTFTSNKATLTVTVTGSFDVSTGAFSASGPVTSATGKLEGASGTLTFEGVEDLSNGTFVEDITGNICVNLRP